MLGEKGCPVFIIWCLADGITGNVIFGNQKIQDIQKFDSLGGRQLKKR